ncbi:MAG: ribonuclease E/G [Defluviitaleaceae bacterium]|nr:ribonuclease E/G [Defluviitaleaceae bacterium]
MKKILISKSSQGTTAVLIENGKLLELLQDTSEASLAGNIYLGVVKKLTGGFIFLDIGEDKQAFLDMRDGRERRHFPQGAPPPMLGTTMLVQVLKDAVGTKGPNVTSSVNYAGRYIMIHESLDADRINCSKKIVDYDEIKRLKRAANNALPPAFSAIVRTSAEGKSEDIIVNEIKQLLARWEADNEKQKNRAPATLWAQSTTTKTIMEMIREDIDQIIVDSLEVFNVIKSEFIPLYPDFSDKIILYTDEESIFAANFIKTQIEKLHEKRVWLRSGGFIVIEQTEACVVVDANTGKQKSKGGEAAKLALNMEAAAEIAYQLRLRNLSGIIIIDFLRLQSKAEMHKLLEFFELELHKDRIPALLVGTTTLGLVEITRKRVRKPLQPTKF